MRCSENFRDITASYRAAAIPVAHEAGAIEVLADALTDESLALGTADCGIVVEGGRNRGFVNSERVFWDGYSEVVGAMQDGGEKVKAPSFEAVIREENHGEAELEFGNRNAF